MRNELIDGTKCQSSEQKGNFLQLLCIAHTTNGSRVIKRSLKYSDTKLKQYTEFLKLHLCMEEWFHDSDKKVEVINAQPQIGTLIITTIFPKKYKHQWIQSSKNAWNY
jgi:hypothetical protein